MKKETGVMVQVDTPAVLIDLDIVENNIKTLVEKLHEYDISYRPHIKTHKSIFLAKLQEKYGAKGIACAKIGEAEVFVEAGFRDVLIAYPIIGELKLARFGKLLEIEGVTLRTVINSVEGAEGLSKLGQTLGKTIEVLIEVDGGMKRGGVKPFEPAVDFAKQVVHLEGIRIVGIAYYDGSIYCLSSKAEVEERAKKEHDEIVGTARLLEEQGFMMAILSGGSSLSSEYPECLKGITESRAGNSIFNDCTRWCKNLIEQEQCALKIAVTVVAKVDDFNFIIDGGTKTFSSDTLAEREGYGFIIGYPEAVLWKMNEEHGFVTSKHSIDMKIGDTLYIIPNHSCQQANLFEFAYGMRNGKVEQMICSDARGKSI